MKIINGTAHTEKRRLLRKKQTAEEEFVWKMLRGRKTGLKWRRQVSIGVYVADFYCAEKRIVLELDGSQHQEEKAVNMTLSVTPFSKAEILRLSEFPIMN